MQAPARHEQRREAVTGTHVWEQITTIEMYVQGSAAIAVIRAQEQDTITGMRVREQATITGMCAREQDTITGMRTQEQASLAGTGMGTTGVRIRVMR